MFLESHLNPNITTKSVTGLESVLRVDHVHQSYCPSAPQSLATGYQDVRTLKRRGTICVHRCKTITSIYINQSVRPKTSICISVDGTPSSYTQFCFMPQHECYESMCFYSQDQGKGPIGLGTGGASGSSKCSRNAESMLSPIFSCTVSDASPRPAAPQSTCGRSMEPLIGICHQRFNRHNKI